MNRRRVVRVPASSANLGPGFDVFAAALALHMDLEVEETGSFAVETSRSRATGATSRSAASSGCTRPTTSRSASARTSRSAAGWGPAPPHTSRA
jgi:homoserine kinase